MTGKTAAELDGRDVGEQVVVNHPGYDKFKHEVLRGVFHKQGGVVGTVMTLLVFFPGGRLTVPGETRVTVYGDDS